MGNRKVVVTQMGDVENVLVKEEDWDEINFLIFGCGLDAGYIHWFIGIASDGLKTGKILVAPGLIAPKTEGEQVLYVYKKISNAYPNYESPEKFSVVSLPVSKK